MGARQTLVAPVASANHLLRPVRHLGRPADTCGARQTTVGVVRHLWGSSVPYAGYLRRPCCLLCQASGTLGMDADRVPGRGVQLCG